MRVQVPVFAALSRFDLSGLVILCFLKQRANVFHPPSRGARAEFYGLWKPPVAHALPPCGFRHWDRAIRREDLGKPDEASLGKGLLVHLGTSALMLSDTDIPHHAAALCDQRPAKKEYV